MGDGELVWGEEYDKGQPFVPVGMKRKARTKKLGFVGWGSKPLIDFLQYIGVDTSKQISQFDVTDIVYKYVNEHNLMHPTKKKKVVCDNWLLSLFGRKNINRIKIYDMLETHFAENQLDSDDDFFLEEEGDGHDQPKKSSSEKPHSKKKVAESPKSCFAAIIGDNIKLVYLKKDLVQDLLKDPDTFENKIMGSFVRIKSDPYDYFQKNSHMLVQVTGLKKLSGADDKNGEILLQVTNFVKDVCISMLSNENFSEEECEDLRQRVRGALLKRLTVVELQEKVQGLHEDVTKHWIVEELALLQRLIDRANIKGWRKELFEYVDRRQLLQTPDEQSRLLREVPEVIAEEIEVDAKSQDFPDKEQQTRDSPKSAIGGASGLPTCDVGANGNSPASVSFGLDAAGRQSASVTSNQDNGMGNSSNQDNGMDLNVIAKEQPNHSTEICNESNGETQPVKIEESKNCNVVDAQVIDFVVDLNVGAKEQNHPSEISGEKNVDMLPMNIEENKSSPGVVNANVIEFVADLNVPAEEQQNHFSVICSESKGATQAVNTKEKKNSQAVSEVQVIELSDDDDDDENADSIGGIQVPDFDVGSFIWFYADPQGVTQGPFSITSLKRWNDADYFPPNFKVWRAGQSQNEAVFLCDIIRKVPPCRNNLGV